MGMNDSPFTRKASFVPSFPLKSQALSSRLKQRSTPRRHCPSVALRPKPSALPPDSFLSERNRGNPPEIYRESPHAFGPYSAREDLPKSSATPSPTGFIHQTISPQPNSQEQDAFLREFASTPVSLPRLRRRVDPYSPIPCENNTPESRKIRAFVVVPRPVLLGSASSSRPNSSDKLEESGRTVEVERKRRRGEAAISPHSTPYKTESHPLDHFVPNLLSLLTKDSDQSGSKRRRRQLRPLAALPTSKGEVILGRGSIGFQSFEKH